MRQVGREDDVHDVLRARTAFGAIESTIATGPSNCTSAEMPSSSRSSRRSASISDSPRRRRRRQQPVLLAGLLLPAEQHAALPAQDRRDADRAAPSVRRDDPKPRTPRSLSGSSSTSTSSNAGTGSTTSCAIRIPGSTTNGSRAIGVQERDLQLAAVARVDETRRVDDRDAVLRRKARPRLDEARVAVRDRDREPGRNERPLAGLRARRARTPTGRDRRRPRRRAPERPRSRAAS